MLLVYSPLCIVCIIFLVIFVFLLQAVYHPTYYQLLQLEQWVIAICGGR